MISSIAWVRRGAAAPVPVTEEALDEAGGVAAAEPVAISKSGGGKKAAGKRRADPEDDDDDSDEGEASARAMTAGNLMHYRSNADDPNITINEDDDLDSEIDDYEINSTDLVLLGARSDEQLSNLEVYVYEEPVDNLYPHHDIPLPVFPLCVAWFDFHPAAAEGSSSSMSRPRGNYAAVGTFAPYIEVWDLDVLDALEPVCIVGAEAAAAMADSQFTSHAAEALAASERQAAGGGKRREDKKSAKRKKKLGAGTAGGPQGHTEAVMCLAWNPLQPNCLASGSADTTVRLWDLEADIGGSTLSMTRHTDKVQALAWHPSEASALLSAGFDRRAIALDVRAPDGPTARQWRLSADAERLRWSPDGFSFVASTEDGLVKCFDVRKGGGKDSSPDDGCLWSLQAHTGATSALDFCPGASDILATGGQDKLVKLWTVGGAEPSLVGRRNMQLGAIFDVSFSPDSPTILGAGGASGKLGVWNTLELEGMQERLPQAEAALGEDGRVLSGAVAGMGKMDVNSSDDEDDDEVQRRRGAQAGASSAAGSSAAVAGGKKSGASKGKADGKAAAEEMDEDHEDDEDDDDDDEEGDDDDDEEDEAPVMTEQTEREAQEAAHAARVSAALAAAAKKARRGKSKGKDKPTFKPKKG